MGKPKKAPQAGAAMVQAKIVKAGGAGLADAECAAIFAQFDPPIVVGTYDSVSSARRSDVAENGKSSPMYNSQSEHQCANSCFQSTRGDSGSNIPGCSNYTEGGAPAYNLYDDQSAGTEHKVMTDAAREFMQTNPDATLGDYLDHMEKKTADMLEDESVQRKSGESGRSRSTAKDKKKRKELAKKAAACLKQHAERTYEKMGIGRDQPLRNGFGTGPAKSAASPAAKGAGKAAI